MIVMTRCEGEESNLSRVSGLLRSCRDSKSDCGVLNGYEMVVDVGKDLGRIQVTDAIGVNFASRDV